MSITSNELIRVVIVDNHTLIRGGIGLIIRDQTDMCVCGEAGTAKESLEVVSQEDPDIILLKLDASNNFNADIIPRLLRNTSNGRIILLARNEEAELNLDALKQGALGLVFKTQKPEVLVKAIRKVNAGEVWIERSLIANVLNDLAMSRSKAPDPDMVKIAELTNRERDVILLIGRGYKNQQIAKQLHLSETTIRHHLTSIYGKLEVSNRLELLVFANRHKLV